MKKYTRQYRSAPFRFIIIISFIIPFFSFILSAQNSVEFLENEGYIRVADHPDLHLENFTLECWVMPLPGGMSIATGATGVRIYPLISRGTHDPDGTTAINYLFGLREDDRVLFFECEADQPGISEMKSYSLSGFSTLKDSTWYHIAVACSGKVITLFLNGKKESSLELFLPPFTAADGDLGIACSFNTSGEIRGSFHGRMDRFRIRNYALSQTELLATINTESDTVSPGLILGLNFNEDSGTILNAIGDIYTQGFNRMAGAHFNTLIPPLLSQDPVMRIGLISDPQYADLDPSTWSNRVYRETLNKLPACIDTLNAREVDFSITLGDIIDTNYVSYDSILPLYQAFEAEHFFLLGNHDFAIDKTHSPEVLSRLGMPDYYYTIDRGNWKFLVLDGTELATYTRVLHPEKAAESDSLLIAIDSEINDHYWNGGISHEQQSWMQQEIMHAADNGQKVILFCHFPLLPDSNQLNLWNKDAIINLIGEYDNVVAYINGHDHLGNYDFRHKVHYLTHYAMVETEDSNSFSILTIFRSGIRIEGFGYNPDRFMGYSDKFRVHEKPQLKDTVLHYYDDSASFIGVPFINGQGNELVNFALIGDTTTNDNEFFCIRNDSLFLTRTPDYLLRKSFTLRLGVIDYLFDSTSTDVSINLDDRFALQNHMLPDTNLYIGTDYSISRDSLFTDFTRNGLDIACMVSDTTRLSYAISDEAIIFHPIRYGPAIVEVIASDSYTGQSLCDTFSVFIHDPDNMPPTHEEYGLLITGRKDTLVILPDTLFFDPDGDSLMYQIGKIQGSITYFSGPDGTLYIRADTGIVTGLTLFADDQRGGFDSLELDLKFNTPPVKTGELERIELTEEEEGREIMLSSIYLDPDLDELFYTFALDPAIASASLYGDVLSLYPSGMGETHLTIQIEDHFGGILQDTLLVNVSAATLYPGHARPSRAWNISPNPATEFLIISSMTTGTGTCSIRISNGSGQCLYQMTPDHSATEPFHAEIPVFNLPGGIYYLSISEAGSLSVNIPFTVQAKE